jgi:Fe-S-cluster containining protein
MTAPLRFRCTGCGNCCRSLRVAITAHDLLRLVRATGRDAGELVAWLEPDAVDMAGEPESFVELSEGRRLMVLAQESGACRLLGSDDRCLAYSARPRDCRTFPFDLGAPAARASSSRLSLLPLVGCDYADDGDNDVAVLEAEDAARWRDLQSYQALVARWNRRAFHRRRLHKSIGAAAAFLDFIERALLPPSESAESKTVP